MTKTEFEKFRTQTDHWIKSGQFAEAQKALSALKVQEVPPAQLQDLCNLYRRAQMWKQSLAALKTKIRPKINPAKSNASPGEKIEYALALQRAGAYRESTLLLSESSVRDRPHAQLAQAFYEIYHWNYEAAGKLLTSFLGSDAVQPYEELTARVNLLACHSQTNSAKFSQELSELKKDLRRSDNRLLLAGVLEIAAYYLIMNRHWSEAEETLAEAETLLRGENSIQLFFVEKWRTAAAALKSSSVEPLDKFRSTALDAKHWETLRDLDYIRALIAPESPLVEWVYFGTPFPAFRRKLERLREFPERAMISRSETPAQTVDPWFVGDGSQLHLLFVLLLRDIYRPARVGHIFSELYWDEFYDVSSVQDRVHQLIRRLRVWIEENKLPFKIMEMESAYALRPNHDAGIVCRKRMLPLEKLPFLFGRFYNEPSEKLSAKEWAERLGVTVVKARNLLAEGVDSNLVSKSGSGSKTLYKIKG